MRWRVILIVASVCVAIGACYWLGDPSTAEVPLMVSLMNHPFFSLSALTIGNIMHDALSQGSLFYMLGSNRTPKFPNIKPLFFISFYIPVVLFFCGAHRRVVAPSIFVNRAREVLVDLSMDCDEYGKLILKPRGPATA